MHVSATWLVPLVVVGAGAGLLAAVAALVRRNVTDLQKAMRPLRVPTRTRRRPGPGQD